MSERFARRVRLGVIAGLGAAFAVAAFGPVAGAVSPTGDAASAKQYADKVTICHRTGSKKNPFRTITVSRNALKAHLKHGDSVGACGPNSVFTLCHKTKKGTKVTVKVKGVKKATRAVKKGDKLGKCKTSGKKNKPQKGKQKGKEKEKEKDKGKSPKKPK